MARIVVTTFGSSGDLNPFIALALGLRARGHTVTFAVEDNMRPALEPLGFPVVHLTGDTGSAVEHHEDKLFASRSPFGLLDVLVNNYIVPTLPTRIGELRAAVAGADLLVSSALQVASRAVHELTGIPWATVALSPITIPSPALQPQPLPVSLPRRVESFSNAASWAVGGAMARRLFDGGVNRVRASVGLPPVRDVLWLGSSSRQLTAVAVSQALWPRPADWSPFVRETGFLLWDRGDEWEEPPRVTEFLAGPGPVIAVSAGSMAPQIRGAFTRFYRAAIEAVGSVGARALVVGAAPGVLPDALPAGVLAIPFAPFSRVYPRCALAVHHGGIGTTAQALRAGVPALVVPWGADQFFTATQIARQGLGHWQPQRRITAERLAHDLRPLLGDPAYRARARAAAGMITAEDGVGTLATLLERVIAGDPPPTDDAPPARTNATSDSSSTAVS